MLAMIDWLLHLPWSNPLFVYAIVWAFALTGMGYFGMLRRFPSLGGALCIIATAFFLPSFVLIGMGYVIHQCIAGSVLYRASGIMLLVLVIGYAASQAGA